MNDKDYNSLKDLLTSCKKANADIAYLHLSNYSSSEQVLFHAKLLSDLCSTIYRNPPYKYENLNHSHYPSTGYLLANGIRTWIGGSVVSNSGHASVKIYYEIARRYAQHLGTDMILCHYSNVEGAEFHPVGCSILHGSLPIINLDYIKKTITNNALFYTEDLTYLRRRLEASRKNMIEVIEFDTK